MSRVAAWCILATIRIARVFNRVIYSVLELMCGFVDTVLQGYLSSSHSDRFAVTSHQGSHDSAQRKDEFNSEEIGSPVVIRTASRLISKKSNAPKRNFTHKKTTSTKHIYLPVSKKMKAIKLIVSYKFTENSNYDRSSSRYSTEEDSSKTNKHEHDATNVAGEIRTRTVSRIPGVSKQNTTEIEQELNALKYKNDRDKNKSTNSDEGNISASYSEKNSSSKLLNKPLYPLSLIQPHESLVKNSTIGKINNENCFQATTILARTLDCSLSENSTNQVDPTVSASEMPSNDIQTPVSVELNDIHPERMCAAPDISLCINTLKVSADKDNHSLESIDKDIEKVVSKNKDVPNMLDSSPKVKVSNEKIENSHKKDTSDYASRMSSSKQDDLSETIELATQIDPKMEIPISERKKDRTEVQQNQSVRKSSPEKVAPKQNVDAEQHSIIAVSVRESISEKSSIPNHSMSEATEQILNVSNNIEILEERAEKSSFKVPQNITVKQRTETISPKHNLKDFNGARSKILNVGHYSEQTSAVTSLKDSSLEKNVLPERNMGKTLKVDQNVASDKKNLQINNGNKPSEDTPRQDDIQALTEPKSGTAATCVDNENETSESVCGTAYKGKLGNEIDAKNKIELNVGSTSTEDDESYKNNINKQEDTDKESDEVRSNCKTFVKMVEESTLKFNEYEKLFHSDNGDDGTVSALTGYIHNRTKHSIQHFYEPICTEPHGNSSDESNSTTPKKSEATNEEKVKKSKKISPIKIKNPEVLKDTEMKKADTTTLQKIDLRQLNQTMDTILEVKPSSEQISTVTSVKDSSSETVNVSPEISGEELKKIDKDAAGEKHKNNEKDISKNTLQETYMKEDSAVAQSKTAATSGEVRNESSKSVNVSAVKGKSKVENELDAKSEPRESITSTSTSNKPGKYNLEIDYVRLLDDTDQNSCEVRSNCKTVKKMEEESARQLKKYREQFYSDDEDQESDAAVIEYLNERIKELIQHPYEPTCTEPHGDSTEELNSKSQKEVPISKNEVQGGAKRKKTKKNIKHR